MAPVSMNWRRCRYAADRKRIEDAGRWGQGKGTRCLALTPASRILHPHHRRRPVLPERPAAMPIANFDLPWLNRLLGKPYDTEVLRESLEQIGCDVDDVVDIERSRCPQCGSLVEHPLGQEEVKACTICSFESETPFKRAGSQKVMRLDLLADRPDLFDVGGLARALRGTLGIETGLPKYSTKPSGLTVKVDKAVTDKSSYRPFIACAVMTLPPVDETSLVAIMKLQENLHWGVVRDRKLSSIAVYDMSAVSGNITYRTIDP